MSAKPHEEQKMPECPAPNCVIASDVRSELQAVKESVARIEAAIVGDEKLGHKGIIARLNSLDKTTLVLFVSVILLGGEKLVKLFF